MLWEVLGWVVSVVGSSLGLMLSVGCFFCDQRPLFHWFAFETNLVIYPFCFSISALLFFVSVSCWACLMILAVETESFRWLLLNFSFFYIEKYKVIAFLVASYIWIWGGTWIGFLGLEFYLGFHIGRIALVFGKEWKSYASHVVSYTFFIFNTNCNWHRLLGVHICFTAES